MSFTIWDEPTGLRNFQIALLYAKGGMSVYRIAKMFKLHHSRVHQIIQRELCTYRVNQLKLF